MSATLAPPTLLTRALCADHQPARTTRIANALRGDTSPLAAVLYLLDWNLDVSTQGSDRVRLLDQNTGHVLVNGFVFYPLYQRADDGDAWVLMLQRTCEVCDKRYDGPAPDYEALKQLILGGARCGCHRTEGT